VDRNRHEAFSKDYMIVSQGEATSLAAREMFERGGNIIDAATAASFAISVERPQSTGIGGGGFMLIHWADSGEVVAVDFRETAPKRAEERMFQSDSGEVIPTLSTEGILASAVPGLVAGVLKVHERYGKLSRREVLAPAIQLAKTGVRIYPHLAHALATNAEVLRRFPASRAALLKPNGEPYQEGEVLRQPDLAKTLEAIAENGSDGFYKGWVADALLAQHRQYKGLLTQADLDAYEVKFRKPVHGTYQDYEIFSMPPPSSGGVHVIEILNLLETENLRQLGAYSVEAIQHTVSAMQQAYADRAKYLGDSDFVKIPMSGLTSKAYARSQREIIHATNARNWQSVSAGSPPGQESTETTHFTIADRQGNVVSSTQTINGWFGSGMVVAGAGFVLNNEMDDFSAKSGIANKFGLISETQNSIVPGKRPLSSMSPTLVRKDGKPVLALGSPAGSRIITCVTLATLNVIEFKLPLYDAVTALRYHHQWLPDELEVEEPGFGAETTRTLEDRGYNVVKRGIGCKIQAIAFEANVLHGVSDPRGEGLALGKSALPVKPTIPNSSTVYPD
jgi:gamma-glutamyltranspeptidase/glutathione hydrolase